MYIKAQLRNKVGNANSCFETHEARKHPYEFFPPFLYLCFDLRSLCAY